MPCPSLTPFQQIDEVRVITGDVNLDLLAKVVTATFSTAQLLCITLLKSLMLLDVLLHVPFVAELSSL